MKKRRMNHLFTISAILVTTIIFASCSINKNDNFEKDNNNDSYLVEEEFISDDLSVDTNDYLEDLIPSVFLSDNDYLYFSEMPIPAEIDAMRIKENLNANNSTFGAVNIRTTLHNTVISITSFLRANANSGGVNFWEDYESGKWNLISYNDELITFESIISNLQGIREYVTNDTANRDIEAAQKLLLYSKINWSIDGLFFAHHILSDLTYWGYMYGFNTDEFYTMMSSEGIAGLDVFYGITNTWGYAYPTRVTDIINSTSTSSIKSFGSSEINEIIELKNEEISQLVSSMNPDDLDLIKEKLSIINKMLSAIVYDGVDLKIYYEQLLDDLDICLSLSTNAVLADDLRYIQLKITDYYEIPKRNTFNPEPDQKFSLIFGKRATNELSRIVFANDQPNVFNEFYYGMTRFLEGEKAIRQ